MDLLTTVIGNAVADPAFRDQLLQNPIETLDNWGFRLTKGEVEIMEEVLHREPAEQLRTKFQALREGLYGKAEVVLCPEKICKMSAYPPKTEQKLREDLKRTAAKKGSETKVA